MIRSTKTSIKFANHGKRQSVGLFLDEYKRVVQLFVDMLWPLEIVPKLCGKEYTDKIETWLSARALQCASKQASGIVRGTRKKQEQRLWKIEQLELLGLYDDVDNVRKAYERNKISKPNLKNVEAELDERFIKQDFAGDTSFDCWIIIGSLGLDSRLSLPLKRTKHFRKLNKLGVIKKGIRLGRNNVTFMFEIEKEPKKKGSREFRKCQTHRDNYIGWAVNQLNFRNIKVVKLEKIKYLRKGKKTNRKMSHWVYDSIFERVERKCESLGVQTIYVEPAYTSQECSVCGNTTRCNRKRKQFKCVSCGHAADADFNASINIARREPIVPGSWKTEDFS